ncbi:hypothetical protein LT679_16350 [Mucilaginibacter roseus]|uniref:SMI1/KNR4 family protein n=1 Tax=Mucilaginibacter roseus TaxID=1528868 RepID=A0ABS8U893_9SPHI|nr:hypothetical protein [Mucilaginibacter roseus]MCD8742184.1 hypothetical protein [Mucilaginibacter roseus]
MIDEDALDYQESLTPQEAFHIEVDLYDSGDYVNILVIPCDDTFIVVAGDEHLCTMTKTCDEPECWEQQDGALDEEAAEKIGRGISDYIDSIN